MRYSYNPPLEPIGGGVPEALVLMLHDRDDGADSLEPLARRWAETVPTAAFMIPSGIKQSDLPVADTTRPEPADWAAIDQSVLRLNLLIAQQLSHYRLEVERLVLVGIGYGGTVALHMGLRRGLAHTGVLAYAGKIERSLSQVASTNGKIRLILNMDGQDFGKGFIGEFVGHLAVRGIDARGVLLPGPTLSEEAIRHGGSYLAELVATAQRANPAGHR
jgi:predicted esterase